MKVTKKNSKVNIADPINEEIISSSAEQINKMFFNETPRSPLVNEKHQKEKLVLEVKNCLINHFNKVEKGAAHIFTKLIELSSNDPSLFSEKIGTEIMNFGVKTGTLINENESFLKDLEDNKSLKEIFGLSNETMAAFYKAAAEIYREKRYQDAAEALSVLVILDPDTYVFWFGLGNAEYFCHQYERALIAYGMAINLKPEEPLNYIFSTNCYEAIHDYNNAMHAIDDALQIMENDQVKHKDTIFKITEQKKSIENKLK